MKAASLIIIGDEILTGKVKDENTFVFTNAMFNWGVKVGRVEVIPDDIGIIAETVNSLKTKFDYVCTSGGVGPTHDDKTFDGLAKAFNRPLREHNEAINYFLAAQEKAGRGRAISSAQKKMLTLPHPCEIYFVEPLYLPLVRLDNVFILPGVPLLFEKSLTGLGHLFEGGQFFRRIIYTDRTEAVIADDLSRIQEKFDEVSIGSYPQIPRLKYGVMVTIEGTLEDLVRRVTEELMPLIEGRHNE